MQTCALIYAEESMCKTHFTSSCPPPRCGSGAARLRLLVGLVPIPYSFVTYAQNRLGYQGNCKTRRRPCFHRLACAQSSDLHAGGGESSSQDPQYCRGTCLPTQFNGGRP